MMLHARPSGLLLLGFLSLSFLLACMCGSSDPAYDKLPGESSEDYNKRIDAMRAEKEAAAQKPEIDFSTSLHTVLVAFAKDANLSGPPADEPCAPLPAGETVGTTHLWLDATWLKDAGLTPEEGAPAERPLGWIEYSSACFPRLKPPSEFMKGWHFSLDRGKKYAIMADRYVIGIGAYDRALPDIGFSGSTGGRYGGGVFVYDLKTATRICQGAFDAQSSDVVEFKSRGIAGKSTNEALQDDFRVNVWKAADARLKAIGAPVTRPPYAREPQCN